MHVVDVIAEQFRELLLDATDAHDRVSRDKSPGDRIEARTELPAIDIRIGDEEPEEQQSNTTYVGRIRIEVDLFVADSEENVSSAVLTLRRQAHVAIMAGSFDGIRSAGATAISRNSSGSIPLGVQTAHFDILFQHSIADPAST